MGLCFLCAVEGDSVGRPPDTLNLTTLISAGFGPWCCFDGSMQSEISCPYFVRAMWTEHFHERPPDLSLCEACIESARTFASSKPSILTENELKVDLDWLSKLNQEYGEPPTPLLEALIEVQRGSKEVVDAARELALRLVGTHMPPVVSLAQEVSQHGDRAWQATGALLLSLDFSPSSLQPFMMEARKRADILLTQWDDPRAILILLQTGLGGAHFFDVKEYWEKKDSRQVLPLAVSALQQQMVQRRLTTAEHWATQSDPIPPVPYRDLASTGTSLNLLRIFQILSCFRTEQAHQLWQTIYAHSLYKDEIIRSGAHLYEYDDPSDQESVAVSCAIAESFTPEEFRGICDYFLRHSAPAGRWALERLQERGLPDDLSEVVRATLARLEEPAERYRRRLTIYYGPLLELAKNRVSTYVVRPPKPASSPEEKATCFIATATLGSDSRHVRFLQEFRDIVLRASTMGRAFVRSYEALSPPLARLIARSTLAKRCAFIFLVYPAIRIATLSARYLRRK